MNDFKVSLRAENVWQLTDGSAAYLVCGDEEALLIDTSAGNVDVKKLCNEITDKPLTVVNTHYHPDHTGCNHMFPCVYVHKADLEKTRSGGSKLIGIEEGYAFELGGRTLEVIHTPGHSPGGISLADYKNRLIFTGDMAADVPIFMVNADCDLEAYMDSLDRILRFETLGFTMLTCHGTTPMDFEICRELIDCAGGILAGEITPVPAKLPIPGKDIPVLLYKNKRAGIFRME